MMHDETSERRCKQSSAYLERDNANQDAQNEEKERDDEPDDSPHCNLEKEKKVCSQQTHA